MTDYRNAPELQASLLGKTTEYKDSYDASLLYPIARKLNRDDLGIDEQALPFQGEDLWTGYELSWLNGKGKPQVAVAEFVFPCQSPSIIESKSFKLYLNSFNQTRFESMDKVREILEADLSKAVQTPVKVTLYGPDDTSQFAATALPGFCIDELDIEIDTFDLDPALLQLATNSEPVEQTLYSHLLKSNCLITSQPDWASVVIRYKGPQLCHESLLRYLVSFRSHNEFHEQCVERIFSDIMALAKPQELEVYARYTRRGGLDINPYRSTHQQHIPFSLRINRQ
ncbi:NADPH-dependent 7-cyano-7-deazaguanine reductase QueF [Pseudoalteromonas sp. BDTF-M6]|uniref:NADPH-dependent 7-cyano-7-deazaguanine reductase QueF n=1 Tax=Pseudoalteromonas sp. BDTF-M6 TaxID=2796132 RepID=UPI001BAEA389|nr:NADPH-dependent 7-cyano-7-deazaguanine reductase QueF [Pseudoalteromonas sp. BDTF-M6]MBS3798604.1 NADPH-dependent 7-cyano-7-deazaguanine reductase QueF [Pseudoalteromonas sp. BDTF-M6]